MGKIPARRTLRLVSLRRPYCYSGVTDTPNAIRHDTARVCATITMPPKKKPPPPATPTPMDMFLKNGTLIGAQPLTKEKRLSQRTPRFVPYDGSMEKFLKRKDASNLTSPRPTKKTPSPVVTDESS